jgi:predicted lipid-binding transport protein (Tim44 family)
VNAFTIILLAMIAAFLGMRLYSVLGKRTGHEQEPVLPRGDDRSPAQPVRLGDNGVQVIDAAAIAKGLVYEPQAEAGLRELLSRDKEFDAGQFMAGAEAAYRMILEAYWSGDRQTLRDLGDDDSYEGFVADIADRESRGETLDNRLIGIESAKIAGVEIVGHEARVSVHYRADISGVTRGADGEVIAGSMTDAAQANDLWTYRRSLNSRDPNWLLDEVEAL